MRRNWPCVTSTREAGLRGDTSLPDRMIGRGREIPQEDLLFTEYRLQTTGVRFPSSQLHPYSAKLLWSRWDVQEVFRTTKCLATGGGVVGESMLS